MALEPEWEATFEPNSSGFRPGRSCHDAIEAIYKAIVQKPKYVLDADIAKCFDRINHQYLLKKLNTFPAMRKQIKAWLKGGVIEDYKLFPTDEGTPQGGTISPLKRQYSPSWVRKQDTRDIPNKDIPWTQDKKDNKFFKS